MEKIKPVVKQLKNLKQKVRIKCINEVENISVNKFKKAPLKDLE